MAGGRSSREFDDRGVTEVVGVILLVGVVVAGAAGILVVSSSLQEDITDQQRMESAEVSMTELDTRMESIANRNDGDPRREFQVTDRGGESVSISEGDEMRIRVVGESVCTTRLELDALRYDLGDPGSLTYQAGGVWKTTPAGTTMVSPPDVRFRDGTLDVSLVDLRGNVDDEFTAEKDLADSNEVTARKKADLFADQGCRRPDAIEIRVTSEEFHDVWASHFEAEMPDGSVTHLPGSQTVTVRLDRGMLTRETDDQRNEVVDFSKPYADVDDGTVVIDKGEDNEYHASVTLIGARGGHTSEMVTDEPTRLTWREPADEVGTESIPEGGLEKHEEASDEGDPVEVTLLLDESGSMASENPSRLRRVKGAARRFLNKLKQVETDHMAALVGYSARHDDGARVYHGLSTDIDDVRTRVNVLTADNRTPIGDGIREASRQFGDSDSEKVLILLSDGNETEESGPVGAARSLDDDVTVHTIGVGSNVDGEMLGNIAGATGGRYHHIENADEMKEVFDRLLADVTAEYQLKEVSTERKVVDGTEVIEVTETTWGKRVQPTFVRTPITLELADDGSTRTLWADGGRVVEGALNYRDGPSAPEVLSVRDDDPVAFTASVHDCTDTTLTDEAVRRGGESYAALRCTAAGDPIGTAETVQSFTDGDPVDDFGDVWGVDDPREVVPERHLTDDGNRFDLDSNQVVVVFEHRGDSDRNRAVVLFEAGKADEEFAADWLLNLEVSVVENEDS